MGVRWSQPKREEAVGAVGNMTGEGELPKPFGARPMSS